MMISRITTFAFDGVGARAIDAQVQLSSGSNAVNIVSLADRELGAKAQVARAAGRCRSRRAPPIAALSSAQLLLDHVPHRRHCIDARETLQRTRASG